METGTSTPPVIAPPPVPVMPPPTSVPPIAFTPPVILPSAFETRPGKAPKSGPGPLAWVVGLAVACVVIVAILYVWGAAIAGSGA